MASKVVVIGNVNCAFQEVFTKLAKLQAKQNFSFAIVVGDLFGECNSDEDLDQISGLLAGNIVVPLPTYFSVGSHPIPTRIIEKIETDDEVCPNLFFIGRRGVLKTSEGIRLAALGGQLAPDSSSDPKINNRYYSLYRASDARSLFGVHNTDVLFTYEWPKGVTSRSKVAIPEGTAAPEGVQCVADVCSTLKPRYHFSAKADFFYEREPFFHMLSDETTDEKPLTRFINLASFSKTSKQKWMYAFTLDPTAPAAGSVPAGSTVSPLTSVTRKRPALESQNDGFQRFSRARPTAPPGPGECFFCLSNPNIATHLITSIGEDAYVTTAKGPLTTADTYPLLGFPGHMLIIPLIHSPTFSAISESEARQNSYNEMRRYRSALNDMVRERTKGGLGSVTWEVSRGNGIHIHWQYLPISTDLLSKGLVEAAFKVEAENLQYPKFERPASDDGVNEAGDYFRVWIWQPSKLDSMDESDSKTAQPLEKTLILPLTPDFRFDLQFGRRVMAKLLRLDKRMDWRDCAQTKDEEETDADAFKAAFKAFDFSLEE
ncbi:CwfJ domain protein [Talaromyces proteolyticus]|uniref:CwfJ domain protein n=1 Tax=Talaromyces proteolyticus TaxID=1131652 RepID=A0AAD4L401_9EURO|nr:CwfJ domain protein [Talaromyces proteolyticus]KAH8705532.1 CwfJ domain protein [Talaromyces proteolyticus]